MQHERVMRAMAQGDLFGSSVRVVTDERGEPWFVARDVCEILGLDNNRQALAGLDEDEKGVTTADTLGGAQTLNTVCESGLYSLILRSRKPEARAFKRWITHEVLPAIRRTGLYSGDAAGLDSALMRTRDYMALRGMAGSVHGLGITAKAVCRHSGLAWRERRRRGHEFPVAALDRAADGRQAARGPLAERPGAMSFFFERNRIGGAE